MHDLFVASKCRVRGQSTPSGHLGHFWSATTGVSPCVQDGVTGWPAWNPLPTGRLDFNTRLGDNPQVNSVVTQVGDDVAAGLGADAGADQRPAAQHELRVPRQDLTQCLAGLLPANPEKKFRRLAGTSFRPPAPPRHQTSAGRHQAATFNCRRNFRRNCSLPLNDRDPSRSATQVITVPPHSAVGGSSSAQCVLQ